MDREEITRYVNANTAEAITLLETLGKIPAPSHHEDLRAEFCRKWFAENTNGEVSIDTAKNVVCKFEVNDGDYAVVMAHTDVVFEDTEELPMRREGNILAAPGIGDDTANLVNLMMAARYLSGKRDQLKKNLLVVANACEEGLGNLDGSKQIFKDYGEKITEFISLDGNLGGLTDKPVGSHRYQITVRTQGGHSYGNFGRDNAIELMARMIEKLYAVELPKETYTTFNVGTIKGGSTVNSIAQECSMLYEYRSENEDCLKYMQEKLNQIIEEFRAEGKDVEIQILGIRPGMGEIDQEKLAAFTEKNLRIIQEYYSEEVRVHAGSTDANIPLSMGVIANTIGTITGKGAHTREEWVDLDSIPAGMSLAIHLLCEYLG